MIVFVHGVPDTPALWRPLISELALQANAFIAPALPGFSRPIPEGFSGSKDAFVAWLIGEMENASEPVDLVGHDWGALLVLRAACLRPDLVSSWCVTNAVIDADYRGHRTARAWATPLLGELTMLAMRDKVRLERGLIAGGMPASLANEEVQHIDKTMRQSILSFTGRRTGCGFAAIGSTILRNYPRAGTSSGVRLTRSSIFPWRSASRANAMYRSTSRTARDIGHATNARTCSRPCSMHTGHAEN